MRQNNKPILKCYSDPCDLIDLVIDTDDKIYKKPHKTNIIASIGGLILTGAIMITLIYTFIILYWFGTCGIGIEC